MVQGGFEKVTVKMEVTPWEIGQE